MAVRLAILGLDPQQHEWLDAVETLRLSGAIELVGIGHRNLSAAKDIADHFKSSTANVAAGPPVFDDLRLFFKDIAPQMILLDRPSNVSLEFLLGCVAQNIGILSLGPPVDTLAEAQALAQALEPRTNLLYIWPRLADTAAYRRCAQAHEFVRPIRFAAASWLGINYALSKTIGAARTGGKHSALAPCNDIAVRSLSVLAWDALASIIDLMDVPTSIYASIRGTIGSGDTFTDLSGAAALSLRFSDDAAASITLCDRAPLSGARSRELLFWGQGGTVRLTGESYEFRDADGKLVDSGTIDASSAGAGHALATLSEFLTHLTEPPSPHRGWPHRLDEVAAAMEAMVVSHRTGQAESPERFRRLRR